jgi:hypothetical protein
MSILSDFEDRVANAVEGLFAGAFRSPVQPVELAKALAKAMDDGRAVGVGKVYAPVAYVVALSREDRRNLGDFTATLEGELATYLADHAREAAYSLPAKPSVTFAMHNDLKLGRFRVSADLSPAKGANAPAEEPAAAAPPHRADAGVFDHAAPTGPAAATVTVGDHDVVLQGARMTIGRVRDCDICLADANVSRTHAALVAQDGGWAVEDLDSTNGTFVNGDPVGVRVLRDGDVLEIGATRLVFHAGRGDA